MSPLLWLLLGAAAAKPAPKPAAPPATPLVEPTAGAWEAAWGAPSRSLAESERARTEGEPLLVYWMGVRASPLGAGPALPGTLVANFEPGETVAASRLRDFTFLAVASAPETAALLAATAPWIASRRMVDRAGGRFEDIALALPDGRAGTISVRQGAPAGGMADGRPAPSLWMHVSAVPAVPAGP